MHIYGEGFFMYKETVGKKFITEENCNKVNSNQTLIQFYQKMIENNPHVCWSLKWIESDVFASQHYGQLQPHMSSAIYAVIKYIL